MNKAIGLALLALGIALIIYGIDASHSAASHISNVINGTPTNRTLWFLIGGIVSAVVGCVMTFMPSHRT